MTLAFIGGTGPEGLGLAVRLAHAGEEIVIGSRREERAHDAAAAIAAKVPGAAVSGATNVGAVERSEVVFITVPYEAQRPTLTDLAATIGDRLVVDTVVPLSFAGGIRAVDVPEGSAAQEAAALLPEARLTSAFHNLSAQKLMELELDLASDVVVCGDDRDARERVIALAGLIQGVRGIDGGPLRNSRYVEELTALILQLNRRYKGEAGVRFTGI